MPKLRKTCAQRSNVKKFKPLSRITDIEANSPLKTIMNYDQLLKKKKKKKICADDNTRPRIRRRELRDTS